MKSRITAPGLMLALAIPLLAAKCGDEPATLSSGEVASDSTYRALDYTITSDNYRRWLTAQSALDNAGATPVERLQIRNATDDDIDRVVRSLEADTASRRAIQSADLTVRDFVLTSIALAQSWDAVNTPATRVAGIPAANVTFLRDQATQNPAVVRTRPTARFIDDGDSDADSDGDSDRASDRDSDGDSEKKQKAKKNKGKKGRG